MDDPEQMEEERRLCYVGVTRAKNRLYMVHTFRRTLYGESELREPSRFLHDVPAHLVRGREGRQKPKQASGGIGAARFLGRTAMPSLSPSRDSRPAVKRSMPAAPSFQTGDEVQHKVFGKGVVIESEPAGDDEQVTVAFAGVGLKRLMAGLSPMEKVERE